MADRALCSRCRRPPIVCFCSELRPRATRTRVVLLQHPKERKVGVGTARLAHLSLPNSIMRVGVDFSADVAVRAALAGVEAAAGGATGLPTARMACVLFPTPGALDVAALPRDRPVTLVVLDGTWSLARKLLRVNPALVALPHVAFTPRRPSQYRIRRQPAEMCLSTIEALAEVLELLEPENGSFDDLLAPFRAMVERQEKFVSDVGAYRHRRRSRQVGRPGGPAARRARLAARLAGDWQRLVCVQGDCNAWPRRDPARQHPEIVHWVAHRPATGETFESVVAPRRPLAPGTVAQTELTATRIGGEDVERWHARWRAFCRPDDIAVTWGSFYSALAVEGGLPLAAERLDLRREVLVLLRAEALPRTAVGAPAGSALRASRTGRLRTVDACAEALRVVSPALGLDGRAGRRLAALVGVLSVLAAFPVARDEDSGSHAMISV